MVLSDTFSSLSETLTRSLLPRSGTRGNAFPAERDREKRLRHRTKVSEAGSYV